MESTQRVTAYAVGCGVAVADRARHLGITASLAPKQGSGMPFADRTGNPSRTTSTLTVTRTLPGPFPEPPV
ncbi:MAG: hypothetical protein R2737_02385 [Candidatus Nanopelagicales bacterium]